MSPEPAHAELKALEHAHKNLKAAEAEGDHEIAVEFALLGIGWALVDIALWMRESVMSR